MARRLYCWLVAGFFALPVTIKTVELLESMRPYHKDHLRLELPDEGQHGHMPELILPSADDLPFPNRAQHDVAIRAWGAELNFHPAYYQSASRSPFRR